MLKKYFCRTTPTFLAVLRSQSKACFIQMQTFKRIERTFNTTNASTNHFPRDIYKYICSLRSNKTFRRFRRLLCNNFEASSKVYRVKLELADLNDPSWETSFLGKLPTKFSARTPRFAIPPWIARVLCEPCSSMIEENVPRAVYIVIT